MIFILGIVLALILIIISAEVDNIFVFILAIFVGIAFMAIDFTWRPTVTKTTDSIITNKIGNIQLKKPAKITLLIKEYKYPFYVGSSDRKDTTYYIGGTIDN